MTDVEMIPTTYDEAVRTPALMPSERQPALTRICSLAQSGRVYSQMLLAVIS